MNRQGRISVFSVTMMLIYGAVGAQATPSRDADRVLVVENGDSAISVTLARDYARRRGAQHLLTLHCKDSSVPGHEVPDPNLRVRDLVGTKIETIDLDAYRRDIEAPIQAYLAAHPGIDFIVLTKGIPIRIDGAGEPNVIDRFSLDSRLAALGYGSLPHVIQVEIAETSYDADWLKLFRQRFRARAWANQFWNSEKRFSHATFGGYLVTRLDGYTAADALALTTRCLQAEQRWHRGAPPGGEILLNAAPELGETDKARQPYSILSERGSSSSREVSITSEQAHLGDLNSDMEHAADVLMARGIPVELERSFHFIGSRAGLMGYMSWGSNDGHFDNAAYHSLRFAPGALAETAVSTSARTFLPATGGQSSIADLIAQGVTGVKGYVDEPLVQAIAAPSILFDRYTKGWTLAESFYAASALVGWEDLVIGDPLCRAYPPQAAVPARLEGRAL